MWHWQGHVQTTISSQWPDLWMGGGDRYSKCPDQSGTSIGHHRKPEIDYMCWNINYNLQGQMSNLATPESNVDW